MYDINRPGYEINKIKDKSFGVISSIYDNGSIVGLTSYNNSYYLLDPKSNECLWKQQVGSHGLHEIVLTSGYSFLVSERYSNTIHIYDNRNLQEEVTHVERLSQSQQVWIGVRFRCRSLRFLSLRMNSISVLETVKVLFRSLHSMALMCLNRKYIMVRIHREV